MKFEWDENKNQENIKKHGVPFEEAKTIFKVNDEEIIRIISARKATENERRDYYERRI